MNHTYSTLFFSYVIRKKIIILVLRKTCEAKVSLLIGKSHKSYEYMKLPFSTSSAHNSLHKFLGSRIALKRMIRLPVKVDFVAFRSIVRLPFRMLLQLTDRNIKPFLKTTLVWIAGHNY
jgi:hypothetical protein